MDRVVDCEFVGETGLLGNGDRVSKASKSSLPKGVTGWLTDLGVDVVGVTGFWGRVEEGVEGGAAWMGVPALEVVGVF